MTRAQAHSLEGIIGAVLLLTSVLFALQITAVTPLSASTSSQHIENQHQASAEGVLAVAADNGALKRAVLFWNDSRNQFHNATTDPYYTRNAPPNEFGEMLERAFDARGLAYNVRIIYENDSQQIIQPMVDQGSPTDHAVSASRTVTLTDNDHLYRETETASSTTLDSTTDFYIEGDESPGSPVYNVVRVEVIAWRI